MQKPPVINRNKARADRVIAFIEQLPLVDGPAVGQNFKVDPFFEDFIRAIYEPEYENGLRVVRRAGLSAARKNSKSYAVAGLLLANLVGPEAIPNGQVFSCAVDREQAAVIFHMCRKMIEMRPTLQKYLKVIPSTKSITVTRSDVKGRGSVYRALSAESSTKHGLGPSFFVYDELGEARDDELLNTMLDGQQAVASPLAVAISTQNPSPHQAFSLWMSYGMSGNDPTAIAHLHAADPDCDIMDREQWVKANPCLLSWKSFAPIEAAAKEALALPGKEQNFRRRYLNQQVSKHSSLIAARDWRDCLDSDLTFEPGEPVFLAYDGAIRTDLAALVMVSAENGSRTKAFFYKPEAYLDEHGKRDVQPYREFARKGWLTAVPGRSIDPMAVALKVAELTSTYEVRGLAYDRWKIDEFLRCLDGVGLEAQKGEGAGLRIVDWGQGFRDMAPAIDAFEHAILEGELRHDGNPLLNSCILNAQSIPDPAGNRKLDKSKTTMRIDGAVALAMALGLKARDRTTAELSSPWDNPDFSLKRARH